MKGCHSLSSVTWAKYLKSDHVERVEVYLAYGSRDREACEYCAALCLVPGEGFLLHHNLVRGVTCTNRASMFLPIYISLPIIH